MIRVVIAEDQHMVLGALAALLQIESDLDVVGQARDGETALGLVRSARPDVLLTDIEMPGMSGIDLTRAVRAEPVKAGGRAVDPALAAEAWNEGDPLSDRERQVLRLAGEGRPGADIAAEMGLAEGTVRNYLSEAISKVGGRNRVDAARIARAKGWL
jgi:two-component system response regulator DesR